MRANAADDAAMGQPSARDDARYFLRACRASQKPRRRYEPPLVYIVRRADTMTIQRERHERRHYYHAAPSASAFRQKAGAPPHECRRAYLTSYRRASFHAEMPLFRMPSATALHANTNFYDARFNAPPLYTTQCQPDAISAPLHRLPLLSAIDTQYRHYYRYHTHVTLAIFTTGLKRHFSSRLKCPAPAAYAPPQRARCYQPMPRRRLRPRRLSHAGTSFDKMGQHEASRHATSAKGLQESGIGQMMICHYCKPSQGQVLDAAMSC